MKTRSSVPLAAAVLAALTLAGCSTDQATTNAADTTTSPGGSSSSGSSRSGEVTPDDTSLPPWPAPVDDVPARVAAAGLDLGPMGTAEHYHPVLGDGTIHIEAHTVGEKFTLGQLFTQWGVALTPTQVGGVAAKDGEKVQVTSNGTPVTGDPADLRLEPDQQIELTLP